MSAFISQQPNGLYCRFSTIVDCPTHWNMTREEYLSNVTGTVANRDEGEQILNHYIKPFSNVIDYFVPNSMSQKEFEEIVMEMGEI